jgi:mannose-6-phosphate isomerase-like protein (cupin superfamily)
MSLGDTPLLETPDKTMRDTVLISDELVGATTMSAGLVWVQPHGEIHEDSHAFDEVYYVIRGRADVIMKGEPMQMNAGDVVYIPAGTLHRIFNPTDQVFQIFWLISSNWADLPNVQREMGTWPKVSHLEGWHVE